MIILSALARTARAAGDTSKPTCAVILDGSSTASGEVASALLENDLAATGALRLVERQQINAVLGEQKLQSVMSADAGNQRAALGKLLKADVLVLLGAQPGSAGELQIVVSETRQGVRLETLSLPQGQPLEQQVRSISDLVANAAERAAMPVTEICAVPLFESKDLSRDHDSLKSSYSKMLQAHLLDHPGFAVVELAEARAIAREVAISGESVRRRLPLYFLGQYRNEGSSQRRTLTVSLVVKRGTVEVARKDIASLAPADAGPFLLKSADESLLQAGNLAVPVPPPDVEVGLIQKRSAEFAAVGDWEEAGGLAEAALLLVPDNLHLQRMAAEGLARRIDDEGTAEQPNQRPAPERAADYHAAMDHLEIYLSHTKLSAWNEQHFLQDFFEADDRWHQHQFLVPEQDLIEFAKRVLEAKIVAGVQDDTPFLLEQYLCGNVGQHTTTDFADRLALCRDGGGVFDSPTAVLHFLDQPSDSSDGFVTDRSIWADAISQLNALPFPNCKAAAAILERRRQLSYVTWADFPPLHWDHPSAALPALVSNTGGPPESGVKLDPISIQWVPPLQAGYLGPLDWFSAAQRAGDHLDALKTDDGLYIMSEAGIARCVSLTSAGGACFDGRYVWTIGQTRDPSLVIFDTQTGKLGHIGTDRGMVPIGRFGSSVFNQTNFLCTPLSPGRICCAGNFGRSWIAVATYTPDTGGSMKVILEARDVINPDNVDGWKDPNAAFRPCWMGTISDGQRGTGHQRVVLSRDGDLGRLSFYPLVIDPDTGNAAVLQQRVDVHPNAPHIAEHDGSLWWSVTYREPRIRDRLVRRIVFPGVKCDMMGVTTPAGQIIFSGETAFIMANDSRQMWWYAANPEGQWHQLQATPKFKQPWCVRLRQSSFYGLIAIGDYYSDAGKVCRVTLPNAGDAQRK